MKKFLYKIAGLAFVGLAVIGVIVPGLPTTPFLLVAAGCFAKSSPKLHQWLLNNKVFAPIIKNWQETRSIPKRAKWISILAIIIVGGISTYFLQHFYLKIIIPLLLIAPIIFLIRLKTTEDISLKLNS
ncbi:hypothetical protein BVY03_01890 [bacterium K02(2017)]|nr:hypothetical protein BVY03_01890 [bacterium K02(2017)]